MNRLRLSLLLIVWLLISCSTANGSGEQTAVSPEPTNSPEPATIPLPDNAPCSTASQHQQIDAAFAAYQTSRTENDAPLLSLSTWVNEIAAELIAECSAEAIELTEPAELADLLANLQMGGYVVYVRHTHTDRSRGDEDVSLGRCDKQRVLSERGRQEALFIGQSFQQLDIPVGTLISTQYCRTLETAVLAFGVPQIIERTDLHATLTELLATQPPAGTNTFIIGHIGTLQDRVGLDDTFEEGDALIYQPDENGGFAFNGRIGLYDWPMLAEIK